MQVVLLKNMSRELIPINVGDADVLVVRHDAAQTKSGQTGTKRVERSVSSSLTLMPGVWTRVPGVALKQSAVKRLLKAGTLCKSEMNDDTAPAIVAAAKIVVEAAPALPGVKGSNLTVDEGTIKVADALKKKTPKGAER